MKLNYKIWMLALLLLAGAQASKGQGVFKLPKYDKFKLSNGLTVYLMEQKEVPLIQASIVFDAGAVHDGNKPGLANFTAQALLFGTKTMTKTQIEQQTDFVGASLSSAAALEYARVGLSFAKKDQDKMLAILKEVLTHPAFNAKEFEKSKKRKLLRLDQIKESPRNVIGTYYNKLLYGNHPYGNPVAGTKEGVNAITLDNIKAFYKKQYTCDKAAIAIVGDFDRRKMKATIKKLLKGWKTKKATSKALVKPDMSYSKSRVLLVDKDDANETTFYIGGQGVARSNPDLVAVQVVNTILGGRFTSWLNDALRVNSGLTYGARSNFVTSKLSGSFYIYSFTKTETAIQAIDMAIGVLDSLHTTGVNKEILESAKNYVKGSFPTRYERNSNLAALLTSMFVYGYNESFINNFTKNVDNLTVAKVKQVIAKYFPKKNLQFVLVGKASAIRDKVKKYGKVTEKKITSQGF
ncbi:pitrilysin family protein [uncultured Microscilla sp.]|uniref:M16 family metallopeptidase n=1 Tax=uncultured Microscilla sp. TaxID=432653 RepID=UPI00260AE9AC|nr:pitrilysin family protein [uncultured Microscilla sp.]